MLIVQEPGVGLPSFTCLVGEPMTGRAEHRELEEFVVEEFHSDGVECRAAQC